MAAKKEITEELIAEWTKLYDNGKTYKEIAKMYGFSLTCVWKRINNKYLYDNFVVTPALKIAVFQAIAGGKSRASICAEFHISEFVYHKIARSYEAVDRVGWIFNHPYALKLKPDERVRYREVVENRAKKYPRNFCQYYEDL